MRRSYKRLRRDEGKDSIEDPFTGMDETEDDNFDIIVNPRIRTTVKGAVLARR